MIAVRMFLREEFAPRLAKYGCVLVEEAGQDGPDPYYKWSYWRTAWGFHFYVPEYGPDGRCPEERLEGVIADIENSRPPGHELK